MKRIKNIFVTGGAGFIGSYLVKKLIRCRNKVVVYDNFSTGKLANLREVKTKIKIIEGDILDFKKLTKYILKYSPDTVFHFAAIHYIPDCTKYPYKTFKTNVEGTENVLKAVSKLKNKPHFIFISSAAVYRNSSRSLSETSHTAPIELYGKTKLLGEKLVKKYYAKINAPYTIIRLFNTYGPNDSVPHVIPKIIKQLKRGNIVKLGNLEPKRDFIFVSDVVDALCLLLTKERKSEIYNLGTGKEYSIDYIIKCLKDLLKDKRKIKVKSDQNLFRKIDRLHLKANIRKIKRDLNWKPKIDIKHGLKITLRKNGIL